MAVVPAEALKDAAIFTEKSAQEGCVNDTAGGEMGHWEQQSASPVTETIPRTDSKCGSPTAKERVRDTIFEMRDDFQHTNPKHEERGSDRPSIRRQEAARRSRSGHGGAAKVNRSCISITGLKGGRKSSTRNLGGFWGLPSDKLAARTGQPTEKLETTSRATRVKWTATSLVTRAKSAETSLMAPESRDRSPPAVGNKLRAGKEET